VRSTEHETGRFTRHKSWLFTGNPRCWLSCRRILTLRFSCSKRFLYFGLRSRQELAVCFVLTKSSVYFD